jgi:hypothetical protein
VQREGQNIAENPCKGRVPICYWWNPRSPIQAGGTRYHFNPRLTFSWQRESHEKQLLAPSLSLQPFWDSLSQIWLTKYALRELDRRNAKALSRPTSSLPVHRPATRSYVSENTHDSPLQRPSAFLHSCGPEVLNEVKLSARRGGPDLSDLSVTDSFLIVKKACYPLN